MKDPKEAAVEAIAELELDEEVLTRFGDVRPFDVVEEVVKSAGGGRATMGIGTRAIDGFSLCDAIGEPG